MIILSRLKLFFNNEKRKDSLIYRMFKRNVFINFLSEKYRRAIFRNHILNSEENIHYLGQILNDQESLDVLSMIVISRKKVYAKAKYNLILNDQYFAEELIEYSQNYTLIDCGAYNGDTVKSFIFKFKNNYNAIYCFEPDGLNFRKLSLYVNSLNSKKIHLINKGLWNKKDFLKFSEGNSSISQIDENANNVVEVTSVDSFFDGKTIFNPILKMDIEGAELEALKGSHCFISKNKPILAICIYHEPNHLFSIPFFIKSNWPFYELKIRHHSKNYSETVLYCFPK